MSTIIIEKDETNSLDTLINSIRQKIDIANEGIGGVWEKETRMAVDLSWRKGEDFWEEGRRRVMMMKEAESNYFDEDKMFDLHRLPPPLLHW